MEDDRASWFCHDAAEPDRIPPSLSTPLLAGTYPELKGEVEPLVNM